MASDHISWGRAHWPDSHPIPCDDGFFGNLQIVHCYGTACTVGNELTVAEDLETDLVDVDTDGVFEVITKESVGFRTRSTWASPPFV